MQLRLVPLNTPGDLQNFIYIQTVEGKDPVVNDGWSKMDNPRVLVVLKHNWFHDVYNE